MQRVGPQRHDNVLIGLICLGMILLSAWSMWQERIVEKVQNGVDGAVYAPPPRLFIEQTELPDAAPPRAYLLEALRIATIVSAQPGMPDRGILLAQARRYVQVAEHVRPHWGEMWVVKAFVYSLSSREFSAIERDALIHSYLDAPYLHNSGRWRAQRSLVEWDALPRFVQDRVAKETVWLYLVSSGPNPLALLQSARASDGYIPVFRELRRTTR